MKRTLLLAAMAIAAFAAPPAFAQTAPPTVVTFSDSANMQSLHDSSKKDVFDVGITDSQISTTLKVTCDAGGTSLLFFHKDRQCAVAGTGSVINPANKQLYHRAQYQGGYTVKADGTTDGSSIVTNYLALGAAPAAQANFSGSLNLRPENTSTGAAALEATVLNKLKTDNTSGSLIDTRVDTVDLNSFFIPGAGLPSDSGCTWTGNMVFAYQTNSWFMDVSATCGGKTLAFKGNMPIVDTPNVANQNQYNLTLTLPAAGAPTDDKSLFATTTGAGGNADLFASVDGISGTIVMKNSDQVTVKVNDVDTQTPARVEASGTLTGTNVPLETVRSLTTLIGILSETFFGA